MRFGLDVIGQQRNGAWSYFGYDGLGSVRHLTDEYGGITARMSYDPYGVPLQTNTASSLGFTGELTDPAASSTCALAPTIPHSASSPAVIRSRASRD